MTEEEARDWLRNTFGPVAVERLEHFAGLLLAEGARQSLIARSTFDAVWSRHIADSAQLVPLSANVGGTWIDVGSGGGLPGIVIAILRDEPLILVEPRRKRADFLRAACENLRLNHVAVSQRSIQLVSTCAGILSARAVANLMDLFAWTQHVVSRETLFLLPRGENAVSDVAIAERTWHGEFHVEQSITDPGSGIVVAHGVRPQ